MAEVRNEVIFLKDYQPFAYEVHHIDLVFDVGEKSTLVTSKIDVSPRKGTPTGTRLDLDGELLTPKRVTVDGRELDENEYEANAQGLSLLSPPDRAFVLETLVELDPENNKRLMGLYRSNGVWCTQCEAEGFRRITYMADRPDVLATYRVRLEADKQMAPVLLANGNLVETGDLKGGRHYAVWDDPHPKPTYLFAVVAGDLGVIRDEFTTASGRHVDLAIYAEHGKQDDCVFAMDALKRSMAWDEKRFGREYDLDVFNIVAVSDFNFGAMENKGLNIFNDRLILAQPDAATDADYGRVESVVAHEYFHNWTGNRITCRDWFQLCLKEGLTVYRDQEFTSDERSRPVKRIEDVRDLRARQFPEDEGPLAHPPRPDQFSEINNFYTATVYDKGAEVVRMLATLLGEEDFRKGTDLYFERHDGEATTIESWLKVFEDATGRDLQQFGIWYTQAGTPEVTAESDWDAETKTCSLKLTQHTAPTPGQSDKQNLVIPIKFGLIGPNGQELEWESVIGGHVEGDIIVLDEAVAELTFTGVASRPVPSLLRGFSAPVKLKSNLMRDDQLFLARHDKDGFNRWQALQEVALQLMVDAVRTGGDLDEGAVAALAAALGETLADKEMDDALKAMALSLPGELAVASAVGHDIDPQAIHVVRRALLASVARRIQGPLSQTHARLALSRDDSQAISAVHGRTLKNACLGLLVATGSAAHSQLAAEQYSAASNMTDRMGALGASVANWTSEARSLLDSFGERVKSDPLMGDKWLSLSAMRPDDGALDAVKSIYNGPDFPRTNPNRMRSLIGAFAMSNVAQFTRTDGAGFEFVAAVCREADGYNPQLSARLLTAFRSWRTWEPKRRQLAEKVLRDLAESDGLSRDLTDILTRTLAG